MAGAHRILALRARARFLIALLAVLVACAPADRRPSPPAATPPRNPPPAAGAAIAADSSYDWHVLVVAPFGSALQDIPGPLHEVLLFRDEARRADETDIPECYAGGAAPPRFAGLEAQEFLLCFRNGRLSRIEATVRLDPAQAPQAFAAACALWLKSATSVAAQRGACDGSDGEVRFSGRLDEQSDPAADPRDPSGTAFAITLDSAADRP
jgi:hypothetical protein